MTEVLCEPHNQQVKDEQFAFLNHYERFIRKRTKISFKGRAELEHYQLSKDKGILSFLCLL